MRIRNLRIYSQDSDYLKTLRDEYRDYGGWDTSLEGNCLTVYALPRNAKSRKQKLREKKSRHRTNAHKHNKD